MDRVFLGLHAGRIAPWAFPVRNPTEQPSQPLALQGNGVATFCTKSGIYRTYKFQGQVLDIFPC